MKKLARFVLAAFFICGISGLCGIATAQNLPAIDVFGGYSYLHFPQPTSGQTPYEQLDLNGWDFSASVNLFHHIGVEGDLSGHYLSGCADVEGVNCSDFSYMIGPRYTFGDRSSKVTFFVHGLVGQDRASLLGLSDNSLSDTSVALAAGGGAVYWASRHIGLQFGPFDFMYTNHLNNSEASSQGSFRAGGGIAFRFGGNFPPVEPKAPEESEGGHRSWIRPWHKSAPAEGQPSESNPNTSARAHAPAAAAAPLPVSHGMPVHSLGLVVAPQEFDGARILQVDPGSVAEMASLHVGDLITSIDGKPVRTPMELAAELSDKTGKIKIGILRGKFATETVIILGAGGQ
jgi:PDZ domain